MSKTEANLQPAYQWPEIVAVLFSIVAMVISGYSLLEGRWQHQDERNTEVLDAVYEDWVDVAKRDDWRVQHLLETPETYYPVRDLARRLTADFDEGEKVRAFLVERAMVNVVFTNFEHLLKQWMLAVDLEDESRQRVLKEEMDFYAEVYLRNPRLLWYWSEAGGGWVNGADPSSIVWFREMVLENPDFPLSIEPDADGILPGFDWRAAAAE
jgi:hypothetical protein